MTKLSITIRVKRSKQLGHLIVGCVLLSACTQMAFATEGSDWLQWRGSNRDSVAAATPVWPKTLDEGTLVEDWSVPLAPSYSGPIVLGKRVFTTETKDKAREVVYAFDRDTGSELWKTGWDGAMQVPFFAMENGSWIRATPACDGKRLFVAGMRDVLVSLDVETGKQLWQVDFMERYGTTLPGFGFASSPLVVGEHVYVQASQSLVKVEAATGKSAWRSAIGAGGQYDSPFSSPIFAKIGGRDLLVVQTRETLKGIEPASGKELWSQEIQAFRGMNILTPTVYNDSVFTSAHSGKGQLWSVSIPSDSESSDSETKLAEKWENKAQAYMSSPVVIGEHLYLHLRNQRFCCIDLKTGKETWRTKPYGKYWSMIAQGDQILALDERGKLLLIRANPAEFELLGEREVSGDSTWAHLAVAGRQIFIRALDRLTAYRWE